MFIRDTIWTVILNGCKLSCIILLIKLFSVVAGDITQKGYEKKRTRLLQQYASKQIGEYFTFLESLRFPQVSSRRYREKIIRDMRSERS